MRGPKIHSMVTAVEVRKFRRVIRGISVKKSRSLQSRSRQPDDRGRTPRLCGVEMGKYIAATSEQSRFDQAAHHVAVPDSGYVHVEP